MATSLSPDQCGEELARLLDAQVDVCRLILKCSEKQQKLVEDRREDELLSLLTDKQRLIDQHQALSAKSQPLRDQWERDRAKAGPQTHNLVEMAWNQLKDVLDKIVRLEDASRALLQDQKAQVSLDIGKLQKGKILNKAYGGATRPPPQARYSDKQG